MCIRNTIEPECFVVKQSHLLDKLMQFLRADGYVHEMKQCSKSHNGRNLTKEFVTSIDSVPDNDGKVSIFPDSLAPGNGGQRE